MSKIADFSFVAASLDKMSHNVKGFAMCGLCAKYFQPHSAKPVLSIVIFSKAMAKMA